MPFSSRHWLFAMLPLTLLFSLPLDAIADATIGVLLGFRH